MKMVILQGLLEHCSIAILSMGRNCDERYVA